MNYQIAYAIKRILSDVARTMIFVGVDIAIANHQKKYNKRLYYNKPNKVYYQKINMKPKPQYMRDKYSIGG